MVRRTYRLMEFDFDKVRGYYHGDPIRIVMHRNGNPGVETVPTLRYGNNSKTFSIHSFADDEVCWDGIAPTMHAYHVTATAAAKAMGYPTMQVNRPLWRRRGDVRAIGIECEDEGTDEHYWLSQATRITALNRAADYLIQFPNINPVKDVHEHAMLDPVRRRLDLGNALNMIDFRLDLVDVLSGDTPWRTTGKIATGARAPAAWQDEVLTGHEEALAKLRALHRYTVAGFKEIEALLEAV